MFLGHAAPTLAGIAGFTRTGEKAVADPAAGLFDGEPATRCPTGPGRPYIRVRAYLLFQLVTPGFAQGVFRSIREEQKDVYKGVVVSLAQERKLRPVFVQRKPIDDQIAWLAKTVRLKGCDSIAEHILQVWLMKSHQDLLVAFLDGVGIPHDGTGSVQDDLPEELDADKLAATVDAILVGRSPELVAAYLWVFQMQKPEGWSELTRLLQEDPRLRLGIVPEGVPDAEASAPEPEEA